MDSAIYLGDKKSLNTLYLTPDEDGYVKIMLAYAKNCGYGQARIAPIELNLIPTESQEKVKCVDIVHTLPETLEYGEAAEFTAYALMSDGTTRHINGYKSDATADDGNAISVTGEGNHFLIERKSDPLYDDGIYSGQIKAEGVGEEKITLFVNVDGEPFSKEVTVTATPASEPVAFSMSLADDGLVYADSSKATDWKSVGYSVVLDKTATVASRYYSRGEYAVTQLTTASGRQVWPHLTTDSQMTMITFKKSVPAAGYYDISFTGYLWKSSSDYDIYINEEYAGQTNCYDATDELSGKTATSNLNTLYLPAGDIEISFRAKNSHYTGAMFFTPKSLNFAPSAVSEIAISAVETSEIPVTMEAGTTYDGTAKALMNSGDYRSFGHMNNGTIPTSDDVIRVSSSNPAVVAVTDVVCVKRVTDAENKDSAFTIDPTTTTYKLNALRAGKAEITVTAIVDGKEKSTTTEVVVSGDAKEATITKNTASVSILALDGGSVKTNISIVDEVEFGEGVEAEAIADSGYKFAYWTDSNGRVLSDKAKETFIINTNTSIKAYFEKIVADDAETVPVYFYNGNGSLFKSGVATKGSVFADLKGDDEPSLTGFKFDKWSVADNAIINNVTRAVALFTDMPNTYTVSVDDGTYSTSYSGKKYGDKITVTAKGSDTFSCWMMGDDIVSYDKSFTFSVYGNMKLTAVYGAALTAAPVAAFEEVGGSYFLIYSVPAGYEKIEAGILFSEGGTPTVGSAYSKAIERTGSGQFTAQPNGGEGDVVARGYVMFRDRDNNIKVIYAD